MSRIEYGDSEDPLDWGRWNARVRSTLNGKPTQKHLRLLREALLALPQHRLIDNDLCDGFDVCAIGALPYKEYRDKGYSHSAAMALLAREHSTGWYTVDWDPVANDFHKKLVMQYEADSYSAREATEEVASSWGINDTLTWLIVEQNDEGGTSETPEQRWQSVMNWLQGCLYISIPMLHACPSCKRDWKCLDDCRFTYLENCPNCAQKQRYYERKLGIKRPPYNRYWMAEHPNHNWEYKRGKKHAEVS